MFRLGKNGAVTVVHSAVPINAENASALLEFVRNTFGGGLPMTVFDLKDVRLFDSAGLETLCTLQEEHVQRGGELKIACVTPLCRDVLDATGVSEWFDIHDEVLSAAGSFLQ